MTEQLIFHFVIRMDFDTHYMKAFISYRQRLTVIIIFFPLVFKKIPLGHFILLNQTSDKNVMHF